jgi:hypothetical protein
MLNKVNRVSLWSIDKLIKAVTIILLIFGSAQASAAWFVSDLTLTELVTTMKTADQAAQLDQLATNKIVTANLAVPPILLMSAAITVVEDTVLAEALALRAAALAAYRTMQCTVIAFKGVKHPSDVIINVACLAMNALRIEMIAAHNAYANQIAAFALLADLATPAVIPILGSATAQSLELQKMQYVHSVNTSLYMAYMQKAEFEIQEYKDLIKVENARKIYGFLQ